MGILDAPGLPTTVAPRVAPPAGFALNVLAIPAIRRLGGGRFHTTLNLDAMRPPAGVTYYCKPTGTVGADGLTPATATTIGAALGKADVGTIVMAPGEYFRDVHATAATTKSINWLASGPGVKVTGWNRPTSTTWTLQAGSIYKTTRASTIAVWDVNTRTTWGDYTPYIKQATLAAVTGPGQWYTDGTTVYVWCLGNTDLSNTANRTQIRLAVESINGVLADGGTHYVRGIDFEGIGATGGGIHARGAAAKIIAEDCTVRYNYNDGFTTTGGQLITRRCTASSNRQDGFNYHNTTGTAGTSEFIEIDAYSHHNGLDGSDTDNGSTAHEDVHGIRVGGTYQNNIGPTVADVNSAKTWSLGCTAGKSDAVSSMQQQSVRVDGSAQIAGAGIATMWLDECTMTGSTYAYGSSNSGLIYVHGCKHAGCVNPINYSDGTDAFVASYDAP